MDQRWYFFLRGYKGSIVESVTCQNSETLSSKQGANLLSDVFLPRKPSLGFRNAINSAFWSHKTRAAVVIKVEDEHTECFINVYFKSMKPIMSLKTWPQYGNVRIFQTA